MSVLLRDAEINFTEDFQTTCFDEVDLGGLVVLTVDQRISCEVDDLRLRCQLVEVFFLDVSEERQLPVKLHLLIELLHLEGKHDLSIIVLVNGYQPSWLSRRDCGWVRFVVEQGSLPKEIVFA